jgi:hypothetical protein
MCMHPPGKEGKTTKGGDAGDRWRQGLAIRVVRGWDKKISPKEREEMRRKGTLCPFEPPVHVYRYDGIYKVRQLVCYDY